MTATRSREKDAARYRAYASLLRQEARSLDNQHDRMRLLEQAQTFEKEADRITGGGA